MSVESHPALSEIILSKPVVLNGGAADVLDHADRPTRAT
jgi:hypothetical protein